MDDSREIPFDFPLLPAPSQDPWVTRYAGVYFGLTTDGRTIFLRRSADPRALFRQVPVSVWRAPRRGPQSRHVWAPELHPLAGKWWIYFAADDGRNRNHRVWALESAGDDPAGPYGRACPVQTGGWSIDATVLRDGERNFLLWSGWEGKEKGPQNLYLAPLADPVTLAGPRVLLTRPGEAWERRGGEVCEGPAVVRRGGVTCVVYAASASWTPHACLGMLVHRGGDWLDPGAWTKTGPIFAPTRAVWGVGHASLVPDVDDDEGGLIFYHAKTRRQRGWRDRNIRAQRFDWDADGLPCFGAPTTGGAS